LEGKLQEIPSLQMAVHQWETRFSESMNELEHWKKQHGDLAGKMNEMRLLEVRIKKYEEKLVFLSSEVERLNSVLRTKVEEIER
jgi:chromosome segregation ATPase